MYVGMEISSRPTNNSTRFDATETSISPATISSSEPRYSGMAPVASGRQAMSTITAPTASANQRPKADSGSARTGLFWTKLAMLTATFAARSVFRCRQFDHTINVVCGILTRFHRKTTSYAANPIANKAIGAQARCEVEKAPPM